MPPGPGSESRYRAGRMPIASYTRRINSRAAYASSATWSRVQKMCASGEAGGGGGGGGARPIGFIELRDGAATYHPIRDPWVDVVAPPATLLVTAAVSVLTRTLTRRRPSRDR